MEKRVAVQDWTSVQHAESEHFDRHWSAMVQESRISWVIPEDEALFRQDLGRTLAYMGERMGNLAGQRALDLGCGPGDFTIFAARRGAIVDAVDIAPAALEITQKRAETNGVADRIRTHLTPGEALDFPAETFDWVLGFGFLHHADIAAVGPEIRRVLKPGGRAIFREPLGMNSLLQFARAHLPYRHKCDHSQHEHPLTYADMELLGSFLGTMRTREFYLLSSVSRLLGSEAGVIFRGLWALDELLLRLFPSLGSWCRYVVVEYTVAPLSKA